MAKCIFTGLTCEQAQVLAGWFEGQGEQDCEVWFEEQGVEAPLTNVREGIEIKDNGDVIVPCYTP